MVSRYLIEAAVIFIIPYALICYFFTKGYRRKSQKATIWVLMLVLSLPSYAFWALMWVVIRTALAE